MSISTLRGIFPEPKPAHKKNFIKENVKHIKHMQGLLQNSDMFQRKPIRSKITKTVSQLNPASVSSRSLSQSRVPSSKLRAAKKKLVKDIPRLKQPKTNVAPNEPIEKLTHRGIQTEAPEEIGMLYKIGVVKYPSPNVLKILAPKSPTLHKKETVPRLNQSPDRDRGDASGIVVQNPHNEDLTDGMQALEIGGKHNFIKENILALKQKGTKQDTTQDSAKAQNYQKGVLPKYLRDRKEEQKKELDIDPDCPEGHVLLPEEERKETLRVLRQSYADRIQELNSMPVRNDTLRMRKRKIAIEEELKKIDEGIKVFQRPKVFVKINA